MLFKIFFAPAAVFAAHFALSIFFDMYEKFPHFDVPFHILGGLAISYCVILTLKYFRSINLLPEMKTVFEIAFVASSVCAVIIIWETCEFSLDYFFGLNTQVSLTNTMVDMILSSSSGLVMACFVKKIHFKKD